MRLPIIVSVYIRAQVCRHVVLVVFVASEVVPTFVFVLFAITVDAFGVLVLVLTTEAGSSNAVDLGGGSKGMRRRFGVGP